MNMALVWHNALQFLTASELLNLVCTCSSASGDNNLAAKRFIRCSVGAVRVFNTADCDKKDQVVEYLASAEVRLIYKFGVTYEMTFNAFCHEHEQYTGCGSLGSLRHCFVPFFWIDGKIWKGARPTLFMHGGGWRFNRLHFYILTDACRWKLESSYLKLQ